MSQNTNLASRAYFPMFGIGDVIYFPGGTSPGNNTRNDVSTYNIVTDTWADTVLQMPGNTGLQRHCAVLLSPAEVWVIGGVDRYKNISFLVLNIIVFI